MPCPFGFGGDDADVDADSDVTERKEEEEVEEGDGLSEGATDTPKMNKSQKEAKHSKELPAEPANGDGVQKQKRKAHVKAEALDDADFDFDKDPVKWFYANQIKSEAEFEKKKEALRAEARKRLDAIMGKKGKGVEWPEDSELDSLSLRSSELSELDSDVDSLSSLISCAESWIEDAKYSTPAENTLQYAAWGSLAALLYAIYVSVQATTLARKVVGVISNAWWPVATLVVCCLQGVAVLVVLLAARYRSKRMLLGGLCGLLALYSAFLLLAAASVMQPTMVDPKLRESACTRFGKQDSGSRLCRMLPSISAQLDETTGALRWADAIGCVSCLSSLMAGVWYLFELAYIEKRAIKHKRRHKRRKHSIPWHKIKIVGPVTNCAGGGGVKSAAVGAGKCPVAHTGAPAAAAPAAAGGKCPFSGVATAAGNKKTN